MAKFEKELIKMLLFGMTGILFSIVITLIGFKHIYNIFGNFTPIFGFILGFSVTYIFIGVGMFLTREKEVHNGKPQKRTTRNQWRY